MPRDAASGLVRMVTLYKHDGTIIGKGGALAAAENCCCKECDPPCDTNNCEECVEGECQSTCVASECEECVDGECVSSCSEGQYCCDGECQDRPCCETDEDCEEGQHCCGGGCQDQPCCETDEDCEGEYCCDGVCQPGPCCEENTQCPPNTICTPGGCLQECGIEEGIATPCPEGTCCFERACTPSSCDDCDPATHVCCGECCVLPCECGGIADGMETMCQPKPAVEMICPAGVQFGAILAPPCECEGDTQTKYYGEPFQLFHEPSTPLKPGKSLLACHKRIVYASVSYGKYLEPEPCWPHNEYTCCVKVKFKKRLYMCDGDRLHDITNEYYVSKDDCVGDPIDDCQVNSGPPYSITIANLGNCPEGTYCVKMNPRECMPCDECDAAEPDTGFFDTKPTCIPPP